MLANIANFTFKWEWGGSGGTEDTGEGGIWGEIYTVHEGFRSKHASLLQEA